jgi:hypothetical protein
MNTGVYQTANTVDTIISAFGVLALYKVTKQLYNLGFYGLQAFSITSTLFWSVMIAAQVNYLTQAYL